MTPDRDRKQAARDKEMGTLYKRTAIVFTVAAVVVIVLTRVINIPTWAAFVVLGAVVVLRVGAGFYLRRRAGAPREIEVRRIWTAHLSSHDLTVIGRDFAAEHRLRASDEETAGTNGLHLRGGWTRWQRRLAGGRLTKDRMFPTTVRITEKDGQVNALFSSDLHQGYLAPAYRERYDRMLTKLADGFEEAMRTRVPDLRVSHQA